MAYNPDTFNQRMARKYGRNLNLTKFSLPELERLGKDVQREVNRRYDIAYSSKQELQNTKAYQTLVKTGGKIGLSRPAGQTPQQRRAQLQREIRRGLEYTAAKTSSYTGYRDWLKKQETAVYNAVESLAGTDQADAMIARLRSDKDFRSNFWAAVRQFQERNFGLYVKRGSPEIIDEIIRKVSELTTIDVDDVVNKVNTSLMAKAAKGQ